MSDLPNCPKCESELTYEDRGLFVCPMCAHEWTSSDTIAESEQEPIYKDVNGNTLQDGDTVIVTKDLKVKGTTLTVKGGTKVKGIRLVDGHDGHDIDCKIKGIGSMQLKSEFVKKA